jgi:hypothetical protein
MNIQILANILKFLERVTVTGSEAYAWAEAHQYIQNEITKAAQLQITPQPKE